MAWGGWGVRDSVRSPGVEMHPSTASCKRKPGICLVHSLDQPGIVLFIFSAWNQSLSLELSCPFSQPGIVLFNLPAWIPELSCPFSQPGIVLFVLSAWNCLVRSLSLEFYCSISQPGIVLFVLTAWNCLVQSAISLGLGGENRDDC